MTITRLCQMCAHREVCAILSSFSSFTVSQFKDKSPINPDELAVICDAFSPDRKAMEATGDRIPLDNAQRPAGTQQAQDDIILEP